MAMPAPMPMPPMPAAPQPDMKSMVEDAVRNQSMADRLARMEGMMMGGGGSGLNIPAPMPFTPEAPVAPVAPDGMQGFAAGGEMSIPGYHTGTDGGLHHVPGSENYGKPKPVYNPESQYDGLTTPRAKSYYDELVLANPGASAADRRRFKNMANLAASDAEAAIANDTRSAAGSGPGPDHFYEQQAEEIRQFNIQQALAEKQAEDARKVAAHTAVVTQQQALLDWRQAQVDAAQARRQTEVDAGSASQNTWSSLVGQMNPEGPPLFFNPNALPDSISKKSNAGYYNIDRTDAPNIPALEF